MNIKHIFQKDAEPFQPFFAFGCLMGLFFLAIWPLHVFGNHIPYPGRIHAFGIVSLFIGSFAIGFLLTALPRFTSTNEAPRWLVFLVLGFSFFECVLIFTQSPLASLFTALKFASVMIFAFSRFRKRQWPLPPSFIWVGFGLFSALIAALGLLIAGPQPIFTTLLLRSLLTSLLMGIGGQLIPRFTGTFREMSFDLESMRKSGMNSTRAQMGLNILFALFYYSGIFIETSAFGSARLGFAIQGLAILLPLVFVWRLYRLPSPGSRSRALWISTWFLPTGYLVSAIFPAYQIHLMHLTYIGGFAAATLVVGSHVFVSHRGLDPKLLMKAWPLGFVGGFFWIAALTRVSAPFENYTSHLGYAALTALAGLFIWCWYFLFGDEAK